MSGAEVEWHVANAEALSLNDGSADVILCAQTLQFLSKKRPCLAEMRRVVAIGGRGRIALSLWAPIAENPYFNTLVNAVARHIGPETAVGLQSAFALSDTNEIYSLLHEAGLGQIEMEVTQLKLPLPELIGFVPRHIQATPMATGFNQAPATARQAVIQVVTETLSEFGENGRVQIPFRSHMILCKN